MVQMVLPEDLERMVPLEILDLKDLRVIKAMMQLTKIALHVHHTVQLKVTQVVLVNQEILVYLVGLANQVLLVILVDAFLVIVESLEQMVNQVMMESMADLVSQGTLEDQEMPFTLQSPPVLISLLV